ncbi:hypothetical protein KM043_010543 [Ampulex compressa]|nr:hypothetical protein KM043_010543 [Ampulex compressa]
MKSCLVRVNFYDFSRDTYPVAGSQESRVAFTLAKKQEPRKRWASVLDESRWKRNRVEKKWANTTLLKGSGEKIVREESLISGAANYSKKYALAEEWRILKMRHVGHAVAFIKETA